MKNEATRAAAAERLLVKEGMPPELPMECDCLDTGMSKLAKIFEREDVTLEEIGVAVTRDPDGFKRWIRATGGKIH